MRRIALLVCVLSALTGCLLSSSPYDYLENWLLREDATRAFSVPADIFYVQSALYLNSSNIPLMYSYAKSEVGNRKFYGLARVFSPLVANADDVECAVRWYFKKHHSDRRPFIFIGEGEDGRLLQAYEKAHENDLKDDGLIASFYTDTSHKGFVTDDMVKKISEAVARARFRDIWGREMPEGMLNE